MILIALIGGLLLLRGIYASEDMDILAAEPELHLNAETLISHFKKENEHYLEPEKIVEIEGAIKEINSINNRITILLEGGANESACVICDMQTDQLKGIKEFKPRDTIRLKGVFKGFLKDAIFLNCIISQRIINE
ncbi:OB-fold protein [Ulvibacterium sp.]|uniref:OB-fold protein n=1 Tax=Ulvibacterium sp. TaxID=2665914 RepID=UPI003BABFE4B